MNRDVCFHDYEKIRFHDYEKIRFHDYEIPIALLVGNIVLTTEQRVSAHKGHSGRSAKGVLNYQTEYSREYSQVLTALHTMYMAVAGAESHTTRW